MSRRGRGGKNRNQSGGNNTGGNNTGGNNTGGNNTGGNNSGGGRQPKRPAHPHNAAAGDGRPQGQPQSDRPASKNATFQSALQPRKTLSRPPSETAPAEKSPTHRYEVAFFDTLIQAKSDFPRLKTLAANCDHLNIVVRAEANMDDPDLTSIGKLFCGAAWALIHDRRKADGWYDSPQE
jgi:hypothetical protein